jgi:hypothetical protein
VHFVQRALYYLKLILLNLPTAGLRHVPPFSTALSKRGPFLNSARLLTSRHLSDLQWFAFFIVGFFLLILISIHNADGKTNWLHADATILAVLVTVTMTTLGWVYQTGNQRLGTIDLFASEISTICRTWLVIDFAGREVDLADKIIDPAAEKDQEDHVLPGGRAAENLPEKPVQISTADAYTPVHDKQLPDLAQFDVGIVTAVTEFYNYREAMIDYWRSRAGATRAKDLQYLERQMLYMLYLACEAARIAIGRLIEYEPDKAESIVNILCTEMAAYCYLLRAYDDEDFRGARLRLRLKRYGDIIDGLEAKMKPDEQWERARTTMALLKLRYDALPERPPAAA